MEDRTCNVEKCNFPRSSRGMCNLHYQRTIKGRPLIQEAAPTYTTCTVDGCQKPPRSRRATMCAMHYHRVYRTGSLDPQRQPQWVDIRGQRFGTLVVAERRDGKWACICDCGFERLASAGELNRTRDNATCAVPGQHLNEQPSYYTAHQRVKGQRGTAKSHACIDCDQQAAHWSYRHDDPDELHSFVGKYLVAYSTKQEHYDPRCVSCHKRFDLNRRDAAKV